MMISDKELIADTETAALLQQYPAWTLDSHILQRKWAFKHFRAGFAFLTEAAMLFEKHNHHGDVALTYRHVSIRLTSHDVGGLTQRDVRMVAALERIHMPNWITSPLPIAYPQAILRMESHVADMHAGRAQEQIWLLEHPALITAGASAKAQDLLQPDRFPVFVTRRGGQYTYHGLGQRIGYVMLDLNVRGRDVRQFVWNIEEWLILTFAELGLTVQRRQGRIGLWVCGADGQEAKIAAVGLRLRKWISFHGFSVNVHPNLEHFQAIVPCGIDPKAYGVTSLAEQGIDISLEHFDGLLQQNFSKVF